MPNGKVNVTYYCLDDYSAEDNSHIDDLRDHGVELDYSSDQVSPEELVKRVKERAPDGVLLDLVLDERQRGRSSEARRIANAYAQALRDAMTLGQIAAMPVALWSSQKKIQGFYEVDYTAHDLYDAVLDKAELSEEAKAAEIALRLRVLAEDYPVITSSRGRGRNGLIRMLGLTTRSASALFDVRIGDHFDHDKRQTHDYARYIRTQLLDQPRPLVDRELLLARLGLAAGDQDQSLPRLLHLLADSAYVGVFSRAWERWWFALVDTWWSKNISDRPLASIKAEDRVQQLNEELNLTLRQAVPIAGCTDTRFWAMCEVEMAPVAVSESFVAASSSDRPWHDPRYISMPAAMRGENSAKVAPEERRRLEILLEQRTG
jgi:hypothetical protein